MRGCAASGCTAKPDGGDAHTHFARLVAPALWGTHRGTSPKLSSSLSGLVSPGSLESLAWRHARSHRGGAACSHQPVEALSPQPGKGALTRLFCHTPGVRIHEASTPIALAASPRQPARSPRGCSRSGRGSAQGPCGTCRRRRRVPRGWCHLGGAGTAGAAHGSFDCTLVNLCCLPAFRQVLSAVNARGAVREQRECKDV